MNDNENLSESQKKSIRLSLIDTATKLLGVTYEYGAEWISYVTIPESLDCSELVEGVYKFNKLRMPDGSQNQFNFTVPIATPKIGDLAFFGKGGKENKIYHVGLVYSDTEIIEARGYQPNTSFETGKVILRPRLNWENYKHFVGYRSHIKLV